MATTKIMRTVYCDVREGSLISQSAPYSFSWEEVEGTNTIGSYYQAEVKTEVPESELVKILQNDNCYLKGSGGFTFVDREFYKSFSSSFRLHRRLGELENFDKDSYPILGNSYRWEWARYLAGQLFGYVLEEN